MNDPETHPTDEQLAALMAATEKDAPSPDPAFLAQLREQSQAAFEGAPAPTVPATPARSPSPRKRTMIPISLRWLAATAAALALIGIGLAYWLIPVRLPDPPKAPEEKFLVEEKLVDDGRIGKVTDAQGAVAVKPVMHERWSPVSPRLVLKPGDWLRTEARGANAVALKLIKSAAVIVGPHSTVELVKADEIKLLEGELEISTGDTAVGLHGPDKQTLSVKGKQHYRVEKEKLVRVEKEPLWLQGFKGTTANESLGSLVASVDGREVPLTVGYHHVTVNIRDQIARTTIEESFVNTTDGVLEGTFYFPLPQDASISGFGMWIGDQLVEADVVEKQRAREIYEDILQSRRDPGLLEWAGGNIFKARVFPIPGRGEKRIKITYTQVLPLQGNRYRYSYGLQSELLKQHPLRDLKIDVTVNSAVPLKSISSPTHQTRAAKTDHSGRVEFSAQEHTPTRDFEAVVEIDGARPDVVVVPHRRGADGYFMVQLTPPGADGSADRPIVPNGEPLRLLLVADTSASMDKTQRAAQSAVLASLLGALTEKDQINLAACDVNCDWAFEKPLPANSTNIAAVLDFLAKRTALGWTDLDKAFASVLKQTDTKTHVVYLGDGIPTTGNADPVAFAKRLQRLYEGKAGTFHAVAVGSSYEPGAMKAIASLGGGSFRRVSADRNAQATALDLLTEIASPGLRDIKVEFVGLRTARVYPETLPNVPAGTQQILLGRYLPEGNDQFGEIVVTGTLAGKPVRYSTKISLKDAEQGNSFIPRLWARMHLDKLLEQGRSESVKQDVIALSEEFNIITPYTSLLVLESDADRERYGVKRRFQMRDGEKFFAQGRDSANFELKQKQMKLAGDYRTALRRSVLAELNSLGRNARLFSGRGSYRGVKTFGASEEYFQFASYDVGALADERLESYLGKRVAEDWDGEPWGRLPFGGPRESDRRVEADSKKQDGAIRDLDEPFAADKLLATDDLSPDFQSFDKLKDSKDGLGYYGFDGPSDDLYAERAFAERPTSGRIIHGFDGTYANPYYRGRARGPQLPWLTSLFPRVAPLTREPKEPRTTWPAPALALSRSLLRTDKLNQMKGGIVVTRQTDGFDHRRGELTSRVTRVELVAPTAWVGRSAPVGGQVLVTWCDAKEFGTYSTAFLLGRVRAANAHDLRELPLELADDSVTPLHVSCSNMVPALEAAGKDRTLVVLKYPSNPDYELRVLVDTAKHVVLTAEYRDKGKVTRTTKFDDFVEVAGTWWAQRVETLDENNRRTALVTQTVSELPADEFAKRMKAELAAKDQVLFLRQPLPSIEQAKAAVRTGKATFDDRAVLTIYFAATQQWERSLEHLRECEKLAASKPGMRWLRDGYLYASRRHDELRKRTLDEAAALAATTDAAARANEHFLAAHLTNWSGQVLETNERLALSDALQKVYERQPAHLNATKAWRVNRSALLESAGQSDKALELTKELATEYPRDYYLQYTYARALVRTGDYPAAYAWLDRALKSEVPWERSEEESLRTEYARFLQDQGRYRDLAEYLAAWVGRNPPSSQAYGYYLSALVWNNRAARAEELAAEWMRAAQIEGELPAPIASRLSAALAFALGQGYNLHSNRVAEHWHAPLAEALLYFARRDTHFHYVGSILNSSRFASTDAGRAARRGLADILRKEVDTLAPERLDSFVEWVWSDAGMELADWTKIAASLRTRWGGEKKPDVKRSLARPLGRITTWLGPTEAVAFKRAQLKAAPEQERAAYAQDLFSALLALSWTAEIEDEALALLEQLADPEDPARALYARVAALHRLTDTMLESRAQARIGTIEQPEKLTRTELQKKHAEARKLAREGFSDRLHKEAPKHAKPFGAWIVAERVWIDVRLERDLTSAADDCWTALATAPVKAKPEEEDEGTAVEVRLDALLRDRFLVTLANLAARKSADPALVERVLKYVDQQLKDYPEEPRWRTEKYRLLVALDRVKDLETELGAWIAGPEPDNRWRMALGYLLAEQGKVAEAIKQFEAIEAADELSPAAYRSLAEWYTVENRREQYERARTAAYKTTPEYTLYQRLNSSLAPWTSTTGNLPTQLDPEVLVVFTALFEKSATPQDYLHLLQQFYGASRDFRLLSMLPDGVIGHTAGKVYPFLQGMQSVLTEVRDEATADELVKRIAALRPSAKTAVDQRALDLLELLVERRSAEVQNQAGPHAEKALAALERAFKREWAPGEPRLMVDFLAALGRVPQEALAKEQLRQLDVLHRGAAVGSLDRFHMATKYAEALVAHTRSADATDILIAALKELEEANKGVLPTSANHALGLLIGLAEGAGHYDRGEKLILAQLKHPVHAEQRDWLANRLNELYYRALQYKGDVSLGTGTALYKALERKLLADVGAADQPHRYRLLEQLVRTYRLANDLKLAGVADDLRAYAFKVLPPILKEQQTNRDSIVRDASDTLASVIGPRAGIEFLLDRVDDEPDWLRYTNQDTWTQQSWRLGDWRTKVNNLGDLEPRFLKLVLTELRRDLRSREGRNRVIYQRQHSYYWQEKEADFEKVAEEVLAERKSSASVEYIAEYLFHGIAHEKRAIEVLLAAHEQKVLAESGRSQLIDYLHRTQRYAESIALLVPLVEARPDNLGYRTSLMYAYYRTEKRAELLALLKRSETFYREKNQWTDGVLSALAESCLNTQLYEQAVAYYEELIPRHQRSHPNGARGDGALSYYYIHAARAYSGTGQTKKAVDMASGAIVCWGPNQEQRKNALAELMQVLVSARDLDAFVVDLDKEKLQSAIVRKAIGQAYVRREAHAKAVAQLHAASELQPDDVEIYTLLLTCHDKLGDREAAVRELLRAVELSRRDIKLYEQLGTRFGALNQPIEAERAFTSIVEMLPNESESHALLAEVRQGQKRWPEAIAHWERVIEIRSLEPTGLLKLAAAQIEFKDFDGAAKTVQKLKGQPWPPRFNDALREVRELERKVETGSKK